MSINTGAGRTLDLNDIAVSAIPPIRQLLPGQEFHVIVEFSLNQGDPHDIAVQWIEESGRRDMECTVSPQYV